MVLGGFRLGKKVKKGVLLCVLGGLGGVVCGGLGRFEW